MIAIQLLRSKRTGFSFSQYARTHYKVCVTSKDGSNEPRNLLRAVTVVAVHEHDNVRIVDHIQSAQARAPVTTALFVHYPRAVRPGHLCRPIHGSVIDHYYVAHRRPRNLTENCRDGLFLV